MTDQDIVALTREDCGRAGAMLGRAFHDDPIWTATFSADRAEKLVTMFTGLAKATVAGAGVAETFPDLAAVALWLPPGKTIGPMAMVRSGFAIPRLAMRLPRGERKSMMAVLFQLNGRRKALMPEPHWYLSAIGVDPDRQGEGLGTTLVRSGLKHAERDQTPVYLETETEGNVVFYERLGFSVLEQVKAEALNVPVWLMARRQPS